MESFHKNGWCSGSGGGCSTRSSICEKNILVAPTGVQKEMLDVDDIIIMDENGAELENCNGLKPSACLSIFHEIYNVSLQPVGAIIHSHSPVFVTITNIFLGEEFKITNLEMIKGVNGHRNTDVLTIPIIANTETEEELASSIASAVKIYPKVS